MISEKKLAYYEHVASQTCSEECQKIITQLVDEVRKLERDADWLAWKITDVGGCRHCCSDCGIMTDPVKCFREAARKAVEGD